MGEKDLMSKMTDVETLGSERICKICPSKTAPLMIDMDTFILHALFRWFDPSVQLLHEANHLIAFQRVYSAFIQQLVL